MKEYFIKRITQQVKKQTQQLVILLLNKFSKLIKHILPQFTFVLHTLFKKLSHLKEICKEQKQINVVLY